MSTHDNKDIIRQFVKTIHDGDSAGLRSLATPSARWWLLGRPDRFPAGGDHAYLDIVEQMSALVPMFAEWSFELVTIVAEGDLVVAECRSSGKTAGGAAYGNQYLSIFEFEEGKIAAIREYMDPLQFLAFQDASAAT